jgi:hypothetical protein
MDVTTSKVNDVKLPRKYFVIFDKEYLYLKLTQVGW